MFHYRADGRTEVCVFSPIRIHPQPSAGRKPLIFLSIRFRPLSSAVLANLPSAVPSETICGWTFILTILQFLIVGMGWLHQRKQGPSSVNLGGYQHEKVNCNFIARNGKGPAFRVSNSGQKGA